jgi:hypothetical protein
VQKWFRKINMMDKENEQDFLRRNKYSITLIQFRNITEERIIRR